MLDAQQSKEVVEEAIFQAGGFQGPFGDSDTLIIAGLVNDPMRIAFQPQVRIRCVARSHDIPDITRVPNGAAARIADIVAFIERNAVKVAVTEA